MTKGFITEGASNNIYFKYEYKNQAKVLLAILNSKVGEYLLSLYNQTINVMPDEIRKFPLVLGGIQEEIIRITDENIDISQNDWNLNETSWDFVKNPLISHNINDNNLYKSSF